MDDALRADLWRANLWAASAISFYFRDHAATPFMVLMADPVKGESVGKEEFAQTVTLDEAASIPVGGFPLSRFVGKVQLTTKVQNARGFSYVTLESMDPAVSTPAAWAAVGQALADYVHNNVTRVTDAMISQSGWPECG